MNLNLTPLPPFPDPDIPERPTTRIGGRVPNPQEVDRLILTIADLLEDESGAYESLVHAAAVADAKYQHAFLTTMATLKDEPGTATSKEKGAKLTHFALWQHKEELDARAKGKLVYIDALRRKLESLRTVAANYRHMA